MYSMSTFKSRPAKRILALVAVTLSITACTELIGLGPDKKYGECIEEADKACDDKIPCTVDRCDENATCQHDEIPDCIECTSNADCPDDEECSPPKCDLETHRCDRTVHTGGETAKTQVAQDCMKVQCTENGLQTVPDAADVEDDDNPCTIDECDGDIPTHTAAPTGAECETDDFPTGACDEQGHCVECVEDEHCEPVGGKPYGCIDKVCFPETCTDRAKKGDETDIDCGGSCPECMDGQNCLVADDCASGFCDDTVCQPCANDGDCTSDRFCKNGVCTEDLEQGGPCGSAGQCKTGFCVDGYCCDIACTGLCTACAAEWTSAADGTCANVETGGDPKNDCALQDAATCDTTGACDGAGACQLYAPGAACGAASCSSDGTNAFAADMCDGDGVCMQGATANCANDGKVCVCMCGAMPCGPGQPCDDAVCADCMTDGDCTGSPAKFCDMGTCKAKLPQGDPCGSSNQCGTGYCQDGVCCGAACLGLCEACDLVGFGGTCTFIAAGTDPDNDCPGAGGTGSVCSGVGTCKGGLGETCPGGAATCASGYCVDNVCCSSACSGSCNACSVAAGAPVNGTCANVTGAGTPSCAEYVCSGTSASCPGSCNNDSSCSAGNYCNGAACVAKKATGQTCTGANECTSEFCADGRCCNAACSGPCDACSVAAGAAMDGTCMNVSGPWNPLCGAYLCDGTSPSCPASCYNDSGCVGGYYCTSNMCIPKKMPGVVCAGDGECQSGSCKGGYCCWGACGSCGVCTAGTGACVPAVAKTLGNPSCNEYYCDGTSSACPDACDNDGDCTPGAFCSGVNGTQGQCKANRLLVLTGSTTQSHGGVYPVMGAWSVTTINGGATQNPVGLAVDGAGQGMGLVRYHNPPPSTNDDQKIRYTKYDGTTWSAFANINGGTVGTTDAAPAIDAWSDSSTFQTAYLRGSLHYTDFFTMTWDGESPVIGPVSAIAPDVAVPGDGKPNLLYVVGAEVRVIEPPWVTPVSLDTGSMTDVAVPPTLIALRGGAMSSLELLAMVVRSDGKMYSYQRNGGSWSVAAQLGTSQTTGDRVAMAPLPGGGAVAVYRQSAATSLWAAFFNPLNNTWSTPTQVSTVATTQPPAVAHGVGVGASAALVELAFADTTDGNKPKHARCTAIANNVCTWTTAVPIHNNAVTSVALAATP